jgi:CBS domain-containing protein
MSKISHILLKNPVVVSNGTKLSEAAQLMKKNKTASVLVSRNGRLAGIVSVEDIMQCVAEKANLDTSVDEIMHSPQLMIDSQKWLSDAITMFERCKASHITVVEHGEKVGIIRVDDILHTYKFNEEGQT